MLKGNKLFDKNIKFAEKYGNKSRLSILIIWSFIVYITILLLPKINTVLNKIPQPLYFKVIITSILGAFLYKKLITDIAVVRKYHGFHYGINEHKMFFIFLIHTATNIMFAISVISHLYVGN